MPEPGSAPEKLAAIARRHGADPAAVVPVPVQGVANRVYLLGNGLVLRIARPEHASDLRKEAVVIPAARRAGVRTPAVAAYDDGELLGTPYMVVERAHGVAPGLPAGPADGRWRDAYRDLGAELATLHEGVGELAGVPVERASDPRVDVEALAIRGYINTEAAQWLTDWFDRLDAYRPDVALTLVHGDAAPGNLLADPGTGRLVAILDWGDAARADPAIEFAKLPLRAVPQVMEGYRGGCDEEWAARILWHHLHWALGRLPTGPEREARHWSAQPGNRLLEVMRFLVADPPEPWAGLR
ncbi:phosphotransferase family protein [Glycomyces paridis]|uniref:Aminoglycoside phosphotransferase family protein n=1 Tax=Glycomyces paridis TaxID=2126555 RepID=A0A4S8PLC0_9ACTN|nr:phosphotransferase [Glycomyces paridis]THV29054.1 aminoglycoside phosphotransferase family protein [Glycomyces paridis]